MKFWGKKESEKFDYSLLGADMHSHLIPGIDDGATDIDEAIQLIRGLREIGFKKLITTPHIMWDIYQNTREDILTGYEKLKGQLMKNNIEIEIGVAAEYFLDDNVKKLLAEKKPLLTLKDKLVLVEFSMASEPIDLKEILFEMQMQGYQPIIAHPERYIYNERNKSFFEDMKFSGYLFQLNIMSLAGAYGKGATELSRYFIKNQYYEFAGTDLHNAHHLSYLQNSSIIHPLTELIDSGKLRNTELL